MLLVKTAESADVEIATGLVSVQTENMDCETAFHAFISQFHIAEYDLKRVSIFETPLSAEIEYAKDFGAVRKPAGYVLKIKKQQIRSKPRFEIRILRKQRQFIKGTDIEFIKNLRSALVTHGKITAVSLDR